MTNDVMHIIAELARKDAVRLVLPGGYRIRNILTGPEAVAFVRRLNIHKAFLSAAGVHPDFGFTIYTGELLGVKRALLETARNSYMLADHHKFGQGALLTFAKFSEIEAVLTDSGISQEIAEAYLAPAFGRKWPQARSTQPIQWQRTDNMLFDLTGKTALVTGTSGGLGQAMAIGLAEAGASVVAISSSGSDKTVEAIRGIGRQAEQISADLSQADGLDSVFAKALSFFGNIDILVNNAGIIRRTPAAEHAYKDWYDVIDLNLSTVFFLSQLAGRHMIERGSGKIINIASMLSFQGGINVPGYTASKHAVAGLTKALANEWAGKGVQVNAIAPGYIETNNTAPIISDEKRYQSITDRIPAGRWGKPEDLKGPTVFLASAASDYMNGHVLCVDGGWMAR